MNIPQSLQEKADDLGWEISPEVSDSLSEGSPPPKYHSGSFPGSWPCLRMAELLLEGQPWRVRYSSRRGQG